MSRHAQPGLELPTSLGRSVLRGLLLALIAGTLSLCARGSWAADWTTIEERPDPESGYHLYSRAVGGSDFPEFRIRGVVNAPPERVARAIEIVLTDPRYAAEGQTREVLHREPDRWLLYTYIDLPSFFSDRDVVAIATLTRNEAASEYELKWSETGDNGPGPKEGVVRMPSSRGSWKLTRADGGKTQVECVSHSDMGGALPAWLVRSRSARFMVDRLTTLRGVAAGF